MTARDWQPGNVFACGSEIGFVYCDHRDGVVKYMWDDGSGDTVKRLFDTARPLAVIDPEAPIPDEWVTAYLGGGSSSPQVLESIRAGLAGLLAHIATPREPKPDEPTGDRATVRDREGVLWTRDNTAPARPWLDVARLWRRGTWADLDVPADGVLFGGVE